MTADTSRDDRERTTEGGGPPAGGRRLTARGPLPMWLGIAIAGLLVLAVVLLGLLAISVMERRWEAIRPMMVVRPLDDWEPDNAVWGENYPRQYESYLRTRITDTETKYGGSYPRNYLEIYPSKVILFAGYGFSKGYLQARGHYYAVQDVLDSARLTRPFNPATCWTCKTTDTPRLMDQMGVREFYAANFHDLVDEVAHPVGCQDCHDPQTLRLRITRPALVEAFEAMGRDINEATHQEMRSLACAQCHSEYYFHNDKRAGMQNYLVFPWREGTTVEAMLEYYDNLDFADFIHPISGAPILKMQHPDYELYLTGIHAYRGVSCADCHMPFRTEGGVKFTDHHIRSPLLNIANSCAVCHRWSEEEIRTRVEAIQTKVEGGRHAAEEALVYAHFDVAAAVQAGAAPEQLETARTLLRRAQIRWDYVAASNGMGFHSPQESMRILGEAANLAQQARVEMARLLGSLGVTEPLRYPDISTREKAWDVAEAFVEGRGVRLLP